MSEDGQWIECVQGGLPVEAVWVDALDDPDGEDWLDDALPEPSP